MKRLWIAAVSCLLLCGTASAVESIVFVDMEQVFNDFYKTKLAKARLKAQQEDTETEKQGLVQEMTGISDEVDTLRKEARDITQSQEIRDGKRLLYEDRLLDLREKEKEISDFVELRKKQQQMQVSRMSQSIMDEIRTAVVDYAQQEGLGAVVDSSPRGAQYGAFIYTHPNLDITETILRLLNSQDPDLNNDKELDVSEDEVQQPEENEEASETNETE